MSEKPILFSGPLVRAILEGRKTVTRRVAKLTDAGHVKEPRGHRRWHPGDPDASAACPYGQPGDLLWVRETWAQWDRGLAFRADCLNPRTGEEDGDSRRCRLDFGVKWRPSIHMPRWACRLLLRVTDVRVERLQEITAEDAVAEGLVRDASHPTGGWVELLRDFRDLWDSIAKPGFGWDDNPWVWRIAFERVGKP